MTRTQDLRADAVADQTNAAMLTAREALVDAIVGRDSKTIVDAISALAVASWNAGWDQCAADHKAILAEHGIDL